MRALAGAVLALALSGCKTKTARPPTSSVEAEPVAVIAGTEGPAVDADGFVYFTELISQRILLYSPNGIVSIYRGDSNGANGMAIDAQGRLIVCEASDRRRRQARVTRTDLATGKMEILSDAYRGEAYAAPNDVTLDSRGRIYFTDAGPVGQLDGGLYRIDTDGRVSRLLEAPAIERPNGVAISPDDKTLYLVESNRVTEMDRRSRPARMIRAYDLSPEGTVSRMRVFHDFYPGRSADGLCIDTAGNVYAAAGLIQRRGTDETLDTKAGIHVFSPAGKPIEFMPIPEDLVTNCAFGGPGNKTLYVTSGKTLYKLPAKIPGLRAR